MHNMEDWDTEAELSGRGDVGFLEGSPFPKMRGASSEKLSLRYDASEIFQDSDPFGKASKIWQSRFCLFITCTVPV